MLYVTQKTFDEEVFNSNILTFVLFGAEWCGPCKLQKNVFKDLIKEHANTIKICVVDADESSELIEKYHIKNVPTLLVFKNSKIPIAEFSGLVKMQKLVEIINEYK